jgi:Family of unknown function (DUF6941)
MAEIVPEALVICEDIRTENNGKLMFIGVYSDAIAVQSVPVNLRSLAFALKLRVEEPGTFDFHFTVAYDKNPKLLHGEGRIELASGARGAVIWLPLIFAPAQLPTDGPYSVRVLIGEEPEVTYSFQVLRQPIPPVAPIQQGPPN